VEAQVDAGVRACGKNPVRKVGDESIDGKAECLSVGRPAGSQAVVEEAFETLGSMPGLLDDF
jgi:hypothetical protein